MAAWQAKSIFFFSLLTTPVSLGRSPRAPSTDERLEGWGCLNHLDWLRPTD